MQHWITGWIHSAANCWKNRIKSGYMRYPGMPTRRQWYGRGHCGYSKNNISLTSLPGFHSWCLLSVHYYDFRSSTPGTTQIPHASTNHKCNLVDLFNHIYDNPTTLSDIGIDATRTQRALQAMAQEWVTGLIATPLAPLTFATPDVRRKHTEARIAQERAAMRVKEAIAHVKNQH